MLSGKLRRIFEWEIVRDPQAVLYLRALSLISQGLIKSVGVSNYGVQHLEGLKAAGRPAPSVSSFNFNAQMRLVAASSSMRLL